MNVICKDGFLVDTESGEVLDYCFELSTKEQDKDLVHYSITPPVPYVPEKFKERMKETNHWLKGKDKWIVLAMQFSKKIDYFRQLENKLCPH